MNKKYERGILLLIVKNNNFTRAIGDDIVGPNERKSNPLVITEDQHVFITNNLSRYDQHVSKEHVIKDQYMYFMDLNRCSENFIIVEFPTGSGGSFLISCLNLSDDVAKHLSKDYKINYIKILLSKSKSASSWFDPINFSFNWDTSEVEKSINNNEFTFIGYHNYKNHTPTKHALNFFNNAKVLRFENWIPFYMIRRYFPDISFDDYFKLSFEERKELFSSINMSEDINLTHYLNEYEHDVDYTWDTSNFFDRKRFLNGIEKLYDDIGLSGFDSELLGWYYDEWIAVMRNWSKP